MKKGLIFFMFIASILFLSGCVQTMPPKDYLKNDRYCESDSDCHIVSYCCCSQARNIYHEGIPRNECEYFCQTVCPYIESVKCENNQCRLVYNPICGNRVCEEGEADYPGGCGPNAPPECLGPPSRSGTCPEDCLDY